MITGIDKVVYGVEDMEECARFFADWGLSPAGASGGGERFETRDGGEVELRPADDPSLPPAFEPGSTLRRLVWGVDDEAGLVALRERLAASGSVDPDADAEGLSCTDPNGLRLGFRVTRRRDPGVAPTPVNVPGRIGRVDRRSPVYERAEPIEIGHVVLFTPALEASLRLYRDVLGFVVSDWYPEAGYFLRTSPEAGHHDLFLITTPEERCGLNHIAFTVRDIHEVFGGGLHLARRGWRTQLGPGRHPLSSAYFWYVHNPAGGLAEYYADEDWCTSAWEPRAWKRTPENFAEWAITGGLDGTTRRQAAPPAQG